MKNFKNILFMLLGVISIGFITTSCNDKFSEKDLLELQVQLGSSEDSLAAVKQLAALNAAGELVSFQVKTVNTNGVGVAGLDVTLGAASSDGAADDQTLTTDANGSVYFNRVAVGGNNLTITGAAIVDALLTLDFGQISEGKHYIVDPITGAILPQSVTENVIITVLDVGVATATVSGVAKIETDLTNATSEVPQNVTIIADLGEGLVVNSSLGTSWNGFAYVDNVKYFIPNNDFAGSIGVAAVDNTTGAYTMTVPAGITFDVIVPNVSATQRIAIGGVDGLLLARPEYRDVTANFGPSFTSPSSIPFIRGATVVFDAPVNSGSGFAVNNFIRATRDEGYTFGSAPTTRTIIATNEIWQFTSLGSGYIASPTVTMTDATGTNMYADAYLDLAITGLTSTTAGVGYPLSIGTFPFDLVYDRIDDNGDGTTTIVPDVLYNGSELSIETDVNGVFTQADINAAIATAASNGDEFFDPTSLDQLAFNATNLRLVAAASVATTDAVIAITTAKSRVSDFSFTGENLTMPAFAFTGGGGATQAALTVEWGSQWTFSLDNTNTVAYGSLPAISFEYEEIDLNPDLLSSINVDVLDLEGTTLSNEPIIDRLQISGTGTIVYQDAAENNETDFFSIMTPMAIVENPTAGQIALARADILTDGTVAGIFDRDEGAGYTSAFGATIEPSATGAPGLGATISLTGGSTDAQGIYTWGWNYTMTNVGSAYLENLNISGIKNYSGVATSVILTSGNIRILDINYGSGFRAPTYDGYDGY